MISLLLLLNAPLTHHFAADSKDTLNNLTPGGPTAMDKPSQLDENTTA